MKPLPSMMITANSGKPPSAAANRWANWSGGTMPGSLSLIASMRAIGGKNAKGGGWTAPNVAMGTGVVHLPRVATLLAEIGFNGPSELQSEYARLAGAETGADKITMPRQYVIGMLKRDVLTIRKSFEMANAGLSI